MNNSPNAVVRGLLSGNEIGMLLQFNSGLPVNIVVEPDLNKDGVSPTTIVRCSSPAIRSTCRRARTSTCDTRAWIPLHNSARGEIIVELKNVFNTIELSAINTTVAVDAAGNPVAAIPSDPNQFPNPGGYEQRKLQLGFKVRF